MTGEEDYLTVPEVAHELGVIRSTVYEAINEGRLPYVTKYGRKLILRSNVEEYKARTRPHGQKPKGRPSSRGKPVEAPPAPEP